MHKYFSIDAENFFICRIFASVTEDINAGYKYKNRAKCGSQDCMSDKYICTRNR